MSVTAFFIEFGSKVLLKGTVAGVSGGAKSVWNVLGAHIITRRAFSEMRGQIDRVTLALQSSATTLKTIGDLLLHLNPNGVPFDPVNVRLEAHAKRFFNLPEPRVSSSKHQPPMLEVQYGREDGVVGGMRMSIRSKRPAGYDGSYTLAEEDIRDKHLCFRPQNLDLAATPARDLIVSFQSHQNLNEVEKAVALLIGAAQEAEREAHRVLHTINSGQADRRQPRRAARGGRLRRR